MLRMSAKLAKANSRTRPVLVRLIELLRTGEWTIWILTVMLVGFLAVSVLSHLYPIETFYREELLMNEIRLALGSSAPILALFTVLFMQKQLNTKKLEEQLGRAHLFLEAAERNADSRSFEFVPGIRQFRDALAMEYKRASAGHYGLSLVLFSAASPSLEVMGKIIQLLHFTLQPGYSVGLISPTTIAVLLPETAPEEARGLAARIEEHISTFAAEIDVYSTVAAYPQQAASLAELEAPIRRLMSESRPTVDAGRLATLRVVR